MGFAARETLEYSVFDVDMISLWMVPWDAGGTLRIGSRPEMAIGRDKLRGVVQYIGGLAWTSIIDLYAGVSTAPVERMAEDQKLHFLALACQDSRGRGYGYSPGGGSMTMTDLGFPRVSCSPVEIGAVDSKFPRSSFPLGELCAEQLDYIRRASRTGLPVCMWTVTGSLLFRSPHKLVRALPVRRCFFIGGLMNARFFQLTDDRPEFVCRACMLTVL